MDKTKFQSGFAHLAIIIVLTIALLGSLGYIYWHNFVQPNANKTKYGNAKINNDTKNDTNKVFNDNLFTFSYPESGWSVGLQDNNDPLANLVESNIVVVKSDDYATENVEGNQIGPVRIANGARVDVSTRGSRADVNDINSETIAQQQKIGMIADVAKTTVSGETAYSYKMVYEGQIYFGTEFVKDNKAFYIRFRPATGQQDNYKSAYELITQTLVIK